MQRFTVSGRDPWVFVAAMLAACGQTDAAPAGDRDQALGCVLDGDSEPAAAVPLTDQGSEGLLCPVQDEDWLSLEVPSGHRLVRISLASSTARSPVQPTYALWSTSPDGSPLKSVAIPEARAVGGPLDDSHCVEPGAYLLVVRDQGDDGQDARNPYRVTVSTAPEPDALEPNDAPSQATSMRSGVGVQGYIACVGDQDVYTLDVQAGDVIQVRLSSDVARYEPSLELLDPDEERVASADHPGAVQRETDIGFAHVAQRTGRYVLRVSDRGDDQADASVPYSLQANILAETDSNEPNDHPDQAVPLAGAPQRCEAAFGEWLQASGTIGAAGDVDYFALPLTGCEGGILEAELTVTVAGGDARAWELQTSLQASLAVVRAHAGSPCTDDEGCRVLDLACDPDDQPAFECSGYFNTCAAEGRCTGATLCLPQGECGAFQLQRHYRSLAVPGTITSSPPANQVRLSAPIAGDSLLFLQVGDYQSDAGDPGAFYTLRARVRQETDPGDRAPVPDNVYADRLNEDTVPLRQSLDRARAMPIHDCTAGDCCDASTWVEGSIGYENDLDLFAAGHPCPGSDCMLRLHYEVEDGPVEHGVFVYNGTRPFFTRELAAGSSGTFGGVGAEVDECFYAYFKHDGYNLLVRDVTDDARDWSSDQRYRICLEKVSDSCEAPCVDYGETGCGQP